MVDKMLEEQIQFEIQERVSEKLKKYERFNDIIGDEIFEILKLESKVIYYPLEDEDIWGISEKINGRFFVCINTSIDYDKQVFAAAHELYHILYNEDGDIIHSPENEEELDDNEKKANRFAAEFLVAEALLLREMKIYSITPENLDMEKILKLSNIFTVPYKTMVRRLFEIKILDKESEEEYMKKTSEEIAILRIRYGYTLKNRGEKIVLDTLINRSIELYEKNLITFERLEYLLSLAGKEPKDLGIVPQKYSFDLEEL